MSENATAADNTETDEFLAAVAELRDGDQSVRTTAHTSSVSAEGWNVGGESTLSL